MMREVIAIAALATLLSGCNPPAICHEGELYQDEAGDGIYTKPRDPLYGHDISIKCVRPMIEASQEGE